VLFGEGDRISADARLAESIELRVDQPTLTGESNPVSKSAAIEEGRAVFANIRRFAVYVFNSNMA
jgi:magnesium-transporting ATPase (P-type)